MKPTLRRAITAGTVLVLAGTAAAGAFATVITPTTPRNGSLVSFGPLMDNGFPTSYKDSKAVRLEACFTADDPLCPAPPGSYDRDPADLVPDQLPGRVLLPARLRGRAGQPGRRYREAARGDRPRGSLRHRSAHPGRPDGVRPDPHQGRRRPRRRHLADHAPLRHRRDHRRCQREAGHQRDPGRRDRARCLQRCARQPGRPVPRVGPGGCPRRPRGLHRRSRRAPHRWSAAPTARTSSRSSGRTQTAATRPSVSGTTSSRCRVATPSTAASTSTRHTSPATTAAVRSTCTHRPTRDSPSRSRPTPHSGPRRS